MRKTTFVIVICLLLSVFSICHAQTHIDISALTEDELLELRDQINARLSELNPTDDILYDDDEITVQWLGFNTEVELSLQNSLLITNKTDHAVYYDLSEIAYNSIQFSSSAARREDVKIESGFSTLTSSHNGFFIDFEDLNKVGISDISDIKEVYIELLIYNSESFDKPAKTCLLQFNVD